MGGWVPIADVELECPFCHKKGVKAKYFPPSIQSRSSRSAAGKKTKIYRVPERYEGITDCPHCGKKSHEIEKALRNGVKDPEKEKKILERLKKQGLFAGEITTKLQ